jgi:hypothetical protein
MIFLCSRREKRCCRAACYIEQESGHGTEGKGPNEQVGHATGLTKKALGTCPMQGAGNASQMAIQRLLTLPGVAPASIREPEPHTLHCACRLSMASQDDVAGRLVN